MWQREETPAETETFTCSPFLLTIFLVVLEFAHNFYSTSLTTWVQTWTDAGWARDIATFGVSMVIIFLILTLFDRQSEVIVEEDYLQIGNSPLHYYRAEDIREIKLKNGILHILTDQAWRIGRYSVRKKQREKAHLMMNEWANLHGIVYKIM